jgi:hypothetical protein
LGPHHSGSHLLTFCALELFGTVQGFSDKVVLAAVRMNLPGYEEEEDDQYEEEELLELRAFLD